jgi:hypothetical protein
MISESQLIGLKAPTVRFSPLETYANLLLRVLLSYIILEHEISIVLVKHTIHMRLIIPFLSYL